MDDKLPDVGGGRGGRRVRSGGRAANAARRSGELFKQMPWRLPDNYDQPTEPLDEQGVAAIHGGAMQILEETGIEFLNEEAQALFREAGCRVDTQVRPPSCICSKISRDHAEYCNPSMTVQS